MITDQAARLRVCTPSSADVPCSTVSDNNRPLCTRRVHLSATAPAKLSQQTAQHSRRSRRYADRIICTGLLYSLSQKVSCFSFVCFLLVLRFVMYCESRGNILRCTEKNNVRLVQTPCSTSLFGANVTSRSVDSYCQAWPSLSHTHLSIIN